ncbi:flocculation protein FLO11-like [Anopheles stephensi]|uniref:flocculation protein FLO11-like n=1 Tax=Anopheles stephensi TaxID=30069 RepID=UPI00165898F0|nr:flocculation protein FLO11-like [Anopheles stephensi]
MILSAKQLVLWIALGSFVGAIAIEENVGTTSLVESHNLTTTTSTTTVTTPTTSTISTTSTTSTTPSTTFSSSTTARTTSSQAISSSSPSTPPILARANPISSTSTSRSIISTTSSATTTKPSAKRQISLNEFQQLVAKVNDEISMLRNQSANLSQTYEELVRRYNDRTSQVPIVLYDVSDCSNSTNVQHDTSTEAIKQKSTVPEVTNPTVSSEEVTTTTAKSTTVTTSTTTAPSSTRRVEDSIQKQTHSKSSSDGALPAEPVPQSSGSSHTQIYGNKYYNYIHYFMYPPSEEQLEEMGSPPTQLNHRRKSGNDSRKAVPQNRWKEVPYRTKNRWEERIDSREESMEPEFSPALRRWPQEPTGEIGSNQRSASSDYRPFYGSPIPAIGGQYRFGGAAQRKPVELPPSPVPAPPKLAPYPLAEERIPSRVVPQEKIFSFIPEKPKPTPPAPVPKVPAYQADRVPSFLERRNTYRNEPPAQLRTTKAPPVRLFTPATTVAREPVTPQSIESLFSFGAKPVTYSIPTTAKPSPGVTRNGWDGYDFSFVRKAQETKKRLQRQQRSSRKGVPEL